MKLSIPAWKNGQYISLAKLLLLFGRFFSGARWSANIEEIAPEPGAELLESLKPSDELTTLELLHAVTPNLQIIDGTIVAIEKESKKKQLCIRAVDSTSWDIDTEKENVIAAVLEEYPEAIEIID